MFSYSHFLFVFIPYAVAECPIGWINGGTFCYHVSEDRLDWGSSQEYCWSLGGNLVEFSSLEEEQTLDSVLNHDVLYWIGLTDFAQEGTWRWQESHQIPSYTNWHENEPNHDGDCAVKILANGWAGKWGDYYCDRNSADNVGPFHALCQMSPVTTTVRTSTISTTPPTPPNNNTTKMTTTKSTTTTIITTTTTSTRTTKKIT